jgi:hypothetical protein
MKKLLLLLVLPVMLLSCQKDDIKPNEPEPQCNCGIITNDDIITDINGQDHYSLTIKNDCSGNLGTYYFTIDVWYNANVGQNFCITNVDSWLPVGPVTVHEVENKEII